MIQYLLPLGIAAAALLAGCSRDEDEGKSPDASKKTPETKASASSAANETPPIRFKAVYLDMDGTTLDPEHEIRPATLAAVDDYRRCGGKLGIATGRVFGQVERYLPKLRPDLPLILFNGGLAIEPDRSKIYFTSRLDAATLRRAIAAGRSIDGIEATVVQLAKVSFVDSGSPKVSAFLERVDIAAERCEDLEASVKRAEAEGDFPIKVLYYVDPKKVDSVAKKLAKSFEGAPSKPVVSSTETVEILPPNIDKGRSLRRLIESLGYSRDDVIVFGDSGNDRGMVGAELFPAGVAMGNCRAVTCSSALFVAGRNDTDTISNVIRRLVMTDSCPYRGLEEVSVER